MPTYCYQCESCDYCLEEFQSFNDTPLKKCPQCKKSSLQRVVTGGLGFSVKGGTSSTSVGGRYISMDSAEQKFQERLAEISHDD